MGYWIRPKSQLRGRNVDCGRVSQVADLFLHRNLWVEWDVMMASGLVRRIRGATSGSREIERR